MHASVRCGFTSRVRFAHLPLFIDFYFLFGFLCFINLFLGCARKRAMWIHLTRSLRSPAVVHWLLFFIWVFMFYKFVFGLCTQACGGIHLTRSLRSPTVVHWFLFFIWVFMFYKFVFWFCTQACDVDSPHMFASLTFRCSLLTSFYYFFLFF